MKPFVHGDLDDALVRDDDTPRQHTRTRRAPKPSYDRADAEREVRMLWGAVRKRIAHPARTSLDFANRLLLTSALAVAIPTVAFGTDAAVAPVDWIGAIAGLSLGGATLIGWLALGARNVTALQKARHQHEQIFQERIPARMNAASESFRGSYAGESVRGLGAIGSLTHASHFLGKKLSSAHQAARWCARDFGFMAFAIAVAAAIACWAILGIRLSFKMPFPILDIAALIGTPLLYLANRSLHRALTGEALDLLTMPPAGATHGEAFDAIERGHERVLNLWGESQPYSVLNADRPRRVRREA